MAYLTYKLVADSDLNQWFQRYLKTESERLAYALFDCDDPLVPLADHGRFALMLLLEVALTRAASEHLPSVLVLRLAADAMGMQVAQIDGDPSAPSPRDFLERLKARTRGTREPEGGSVPAAEEASGPPPKFRIVRAGQVTERVLQVLHTHPATRTLFAEDMADSDGLDLTNELTTQIASLIGEGVQ